MKTNKLIKNDKRLLIYHYILKHPYLHLCELVRELNIPKATLTYHLRYLEKNDIIISNHEGRYVRYSITNSIGNAEKKILNIFRQDTARNVLLYIMFYASASQIEIAKDLGKSTKAIEFHLKRLLNLDIIERAHVDKGIIYTALKNSVTIERKPCKNEIFYRLKEPSKMKVYSILLKYYNKKIINGPIVDSIINYNEYVCRKNPPVRIKTTKQAIESLEKILFEIFPHPYYA